MNLRYRAEFQIGQFLPLIVMDRHRKHVHLGVRVRAQNLLIIVLMGQQRRTVFFYGGMGVDRGRTIMVEMEFLELPL